ncbi:MAG: TonB-dependent hemoglobin/transferrin/lactoferrin family receptor [Xanthomonadales bacterium]|nr:TonB-dependent hemoglobin/transferrin/lactoferrin family receptor [Xanthomonadales bacterium]
MKRTFKQTQLFSALTAALFALGANVVLAQDAADEGAEEEAVELDKVVVVGGRVEQNIEDVAGSISVMTGEDIENEMVSDMSQLFRYEPGIDITGSNGTAQNFIVRGMGADRVMMIKDGMRMNEGYGADGANDVVGRGFIDIDTIKQVEVAKGAASSLYGADALGGIVAFATKDAGDLLGPGDDFFVSANTDYDGRSDEIGIGVLTAFRVGNFETLVSYKDRSGHETQNFTKERDAADIDSESLLFKTDYIIDADKKLTFSYDYYLQEVFVPDDGRDKGNYFGLPGWKINFEESSNEKENNSYKVRYQDYNVGMGFADTLDINVYRNDSEQRDDFRLNHDTDGFGYTGYRDTVRSDLFSQETTGVSLSASKVFGEGNSHQLSYGFDWDSTDSFRPRVETRTQSTGEVLLDDLTAPFPKNTTERLGVYLQNSIDLTDKWKLIPGLRYDHYKLTPKADEGYEVVNPGDFVVEKISDDNLSWRIGTLYDINDDLTLSFQYSQGFKVPPYDLAYFYFDHEELFSGFGIRIIPANDLVPEESDTFEIGIRGEIGKLSYNLSYYMADYDNFIQVVYLETIPETNYDFGFPLPIDVDVFQYQNIERAEISGFEWRFDYYLGNNFSLFFNGEWMDSEDKSTGDQLRTIRPMTGALGVNYYAGNFSMDVIAKRELDMNKNPEGAFKTDGWTSWDMFARYSFGDRVQLSAGIFNMFDNEYIEYSSVGGIPNDGRDLTRYTQPGRTLSARVKVNF